MRISEDLASAIGNTPLIRLRRLSEETGCDILGKAEFLNPGQSVKDRAALFIIRDAVARGDLNRAALSWKVQLVIPGSVLRWWGPRWGSRRSLSSPKPRARKRRT